MSIKMRLLLSYIAMTVIPAILFALIAWGLSSAFFSRWGAHRGWKTGFPGEDRTA